jgi:hypothetical protein
VRSCGAQFLLISGKSTGPTGETEAQEFLRLVTEYDNVNEPDPAKRVEIRHRLADRLGQLAISLKEVRRDLASGSEGRLVALATAVVRSPARGDLGALVAAAENVKFKFTGYRIVLALVSLLSGDNVRPTTLARVEDAVKEVAANTDAKSDPPLQRLVGRALEAITALRQELS